MKRIVLAALLFALAGCTLIPNPEPQPSPLIVRSEAQLVEPPSVHPAPFNPTHDPTLCGGWTNDGSDRGIGGYGFGGRGYVMRDGRVVVDETCPPEFWDAESKPKE